jgi:hypothetical protein
MDGAEGSVQGGELKPIQSAVIAQRESDTLSLVMAGLDPAIHVFVCQKARRMHGT